MNLLLYLNNYGFVDGEPVTMIMATHNPDLEIYADRVIYMKDGIISQQVINRKQFPIDHDLYMEYLESKKNQ